MSLLLAVLGVVLPATPFTEYRQDVLGALRAAHPGIALYAYVQADYTWPANQPDSAVHLPTRHYHLVRNLNGFLYVDRLTGKWAKKAKKAVRARGWGEPGSSWLPGEDRDPFGHDDDPPEEERAD